MNGIDVSHHQGHINWKEVRHGGIGFAFIKATEGLTLTDPMFRENWEGARKSGIHRGAYHFFRPQLDAEKQAMQFLHLLGNDAGELPPALDFEVLDDTTTEEALDRASRWTTLITQSLGCTPTLYTGSSFWRTTLNNSNAFAEHPLWIAHYTHAVSPMVPSAWPTWTFWQYSQSGRVPGISGSVDLNVFNGTTQDFERNLIGKVCDEKKGASSRGPAIREVSICLLFL